MIGSSNLSESNRPVRLPSLAKEKVWGSTHLSPWYPDSDKNIGEVWFEADLPLLVKFIFTSENLSVQVHPDDDFASKYENSRGKTEMWHILRAEPGARIAIGFHEAISPNHLRSASASGEIEKLLKWVNVRAGETYFIPAGTVHAIGAGIALCEIQQHSDVTYRLYDYGRPRELHLDKAAQVSSLRAHEGKPVPLPIASEYFHTNLQEASKPLQYAADPARFQLLVILEGAGTIAGQAYRLGEAWYVPAGIEPFTIEPDRATRMLRTQPP